MLFISNLRGRTIESFEREGLRPSGWLLSAHRLSSATLGFAHRVREQGDILFADNGMKEHIDAVLARFRAPSAAILSEVRELRRELGTIPRGQAVPPDLRRRASDLAGEVVAAAVELSRGTDAEEVLEQQLSMRPTHLIANEDFATTCLIGLNLERETTGWSVDYFYRRNRRSLQLWEEVASDPRCREVEVYAVLSAVDYNTARIAGRLAAEAGAASVAVGMAGIMLDPTATDFYVHGYGSFHLDRSVPRRYVRLAQVVRGICDGYREAGGSLKSFHALGLGSPPLFLVLAAAVDPGTSLTADATSPIHDSVRSGVLYDPTANAARLSHINAVRQTLGEDWEWSFTCPFCSRSRDKLGYAPANARKWWAEQGEPRIDEDDIAADSPLVDWLPLFTRHTGDRLSTVNCLRVAHNHWALEHFLSKFPEDSERQCWARRGIEQWGSTGSTTIVRGLKGACEVLDR